MYVRVWVWASILPPDPWGDRPRCGVCALLYPPKATADYTCDGDGVPENPEHRALHNYMCTKKTQTTIPVQYQRCLLVMVVTRHGFEFKVYTAGPTIGVR